MIANVPTDPHDFQQWRIGIDRLKRECPAVVAWLERSALETVDAAEVSKDEDLYRYMGALRDLRTILRYIGNPPDNPSGTPQAMSGTGGLM